MRRRRQTFKRTAGRTLSAAVLALTTLVFAPTAASAEAADLVCETREDYDVQTLTWNAVGADGQRYQILENDKWKTSATDLRYEGELGKSYAIRAYLNGSKIEGDCGDTPPPPPPPPGGDLVCTMDANAKMMWNQVGNAAQRYQIIEDSKWKTSVTGTTYQGVLGRTYVIRAYIGGKKLDGDCGNTPPPPPPPPGGDLVCTIDANAKMTWNQIGPVSQKFQIIEDNKWKTSVTGTTYQGVRGRTYDIVTFLDGQRLDGNCGSTPPPPPPPTLPVCQELTGSRSINEGGSTFYKVTLDAPAPQAMQFTVSAKNGTATHVGNVQGVTQQAFALTGWVEWNGVRRSNEGVIITNGAGQWVSSNGQTFPDRDYSLYLNGVIQDSNTVTVTVPKGATMSNQVEIKAWKEWILWDARAWFDYRVNNLGDGTIPSTASEYLASVEVAEKFSLTVDGTSCKVQVTINDDAWIRQSGNYSPIILDLDGGGITTTPLHDSTATFDLLDNGTQIRSGWSTEAFLAHDENGDGVINSRGELFGGDKRGEGYAKLATFDTNGDGVVSAADDNFNELSLWVDANQNRITDTGELVSLSDAGVASIGTAYEWDGSDDNGNTLGETGVATLRSGRQIAAVDVYFSI